MTRVRLAEVTLKKLWDRHRLTEGFLHAVEDWLLTGGWALVFASKTYAAVRIDAVLNWPRISSTRIADELLDVKRGEYDFGQLEHLLIVDEMVEELPDRDSELGNRRRLLLVCAVQFLLAIRSMPIRLYGSRWPPRLPSQTAQSLHLGSAGKVLGADLSSSGSRARTTLHWPTSNG